MPNTRHKSHSFQYQSGCVSFKTPLSKVDFYNLHFHPVIPDLCKKTEKSADGRVFQIVVAQHIAATCDLQAAVPRRKLAFCVRNSKICAHVLDFRALEPGFGDHLYCRPIGSIKDQHTAGESVCHSLHQCLDLLGQKIIEHAGGKEHRTARCIDFRKPFGIIQIAWDVFLTLSGGQELIAHGDDIRKIQIVDLAAAVVATSAGAVQPAAEIDHCGVGVDFQIVLYFKSQDRSVAWQPPASRSAA